jgi:hypothetical protein
MPRRQLLHTCGLLLLLLLLLLLRGRCRSPPLVKQQERRRHDAGQQDGGHRDHAGCWHVVKHAAVDGCASVAAMDGGAQFRSCSQPARGGQEEQPRAGKLHGAAGGSTRQLKAAAGGTRRVPARPP